MRCPALRGRLALWGAALLCAAAHAVAPDTPVAALLREPVLVEAASGLTTVLTRLRQGRTQLAVVADGDRELGVVTLADILPGLMPDSILDAGVPTEE